MLGVSANSGNKNCVVLQKLKEKCKKCINCKEIPVDKVMLYIQCTLYAEVLRLDDDDFLLLREWYKIFS